MGKLFAGMIGLVISFSVAAQPAEKEQRQHLRDYSPGKPNGQQLHPLKLNLTVEQRSKLELLRERFRNELKELATNQNLTAKEQADKRTVAAEQYKREVEAILTAEQKIEIEEQRAKLNSVPKFILKQLNLSTEQTERLKGLSKDFKLNAAAIASNSELGEEEKKKKLAALNAKQSEDIKAILTQEQKGKLEELKKNQPPRKVI